MMAGVEHLTPEDPEEFASALLGPLQDAEATPFQNPAPVKMPGRVR
jgi:hypothetical protein